ncbi:DUF962 domain-containing protein [Dongia soli]|uniref:DUF962 domain-containing protein n=1 Tax=Dongia soli TaxID=600628 RepID=A0ABU5EFL1_9PROT|nr:DUF962 domain-containing protein [Dongia soli]MDY0885122.1 DUF962 domain-containing protein [Dongia soli]
MTFKSFWPVYLTHHSLPGTRLLHYFATAIGLLSAVEAIVMGRPLVLLAGIAVGYMVAISSHWLIEHNPPLIRINALWGAMAELRMCWLALRGRLAEDLLDSDTWRRHRQKFERSRTALASRRGRYTMLTIGALGLIAGLLDLGDIFEPDAGLHYPIIQLGVPVAAFIAAMVAGIKSIALARLAGPVATGAAPADPGSLNVAMASLSGDARSVIGDSLWRAHLLLLAFGAMTMALAEFAEASFQPSAEFYLAAILLAGAICCVAVVLGASARRPAGRFCDSDRCDTET